jgi:hypothetical protein
LSFATAGGPASKGSGKGGGGPAGAWGKGRSSSTVVTVNLAGDDMEDLLGGGGGGGGGGGAPSDANDFGGEGYLGFLKGRRCPLWPVVFCLATSPTEGPRVKALRLLATMSAEPDVAVAICSAHEARVPVDRKAAACPPALSLRESRSSKGGGSRPGSETAGGEDFGMDSVFTATGDGSGRHSMSSMPIGGRTGSSEKLSSMGGGGGGNASVPRGGLQFSTNPMAGGGGGGGGGMNALGVGGRAGLASVPRGGLNVSRALAHAASSPGMVGGQAQGTSPGGTARLVLDSMQEGDGDDDGEAAGGNGGQGGGKAGVNSGPGTPRRAPVVGAVLNLLSAEHGEATRLLVLAFLEHLLVHASAVSGAEPILRAVCTPELLGAAEALATIHAKARRQFAEAVSEAKLRSGQRLLDLGIIKPPPPPPMPVQPSGRGRTMSISYEDPSLNAPPQAPRAEGPVSLAASAHASGALDVANGAALCLWHIGCILTQHPESAKTRGVKPSQSFAAFEGKLLQAV